MSVDILMEEFDKVMDRRSVQVVLDVGSRNATVAIAFKEYFPGADVYAFECNPPAVEDCRRNILGLPGIILVDKAVSDVSGPVDFWAIDPERTVTPWPDGNIAASSLFVANPAYPDEKYYQNRITVDAITLAEWASDSGVQAVDVIWMDLQGAELKALRGMGDLLSTVRLVYTEVEYREMYLGQPLSDEIDQYLVSRGFQLCRKLNTSAWFGDEIYVRPGGQSE